MSYRTTKRSARYQGMKGKLGRGAMTKHRAYARAPARMYVSRTPGGNIVSESKYFTTFRETGVVDESASMADKEMDPATLNCLFAPIIGNDITNRVGRRVAVTKIMIRGNIQLTPLGSLTSPVNSPLHRLILYMDTQTNATQSQSEQLLEASGTPTLAAGVFNAFQNTANFGRFRVLRDKVFSARNADAFNDAATTGTTAPPVTPFRFTIKFRKPVVVNFNATNGGTVADIVDNSFHLIAMKSATGYVSNIHYACRVTYKDI